MTSRTDPKSSPKTAGGAPRAFPATGFLFIDPDLNVVKAPPEVKQTSTTKARGQGTRVLGRELINLEQTITIAVHSFKKAIAREPAIDVQALLQEMSTDLAAAAQERAPTVSTEDAWQALLLKSLADKTQLLQSTKFRSTGEAAAVLGVGEPAIRKRIRDHRLFALTAPGNDEHRIPVWALGLNAEDTKALIAAQADAWALYLYLETPSGALNGMRPFELLLPTDSLTFEQKSQREALSAFLGLADRGSLLRMVLQDLEADKVPAA